MSVTTDTTSQYNLNPYGTAKQNTTRTSEKADAKTEEEKKMPIVTNAEKIGAEKNKIETAQKMLDKGMDTQTISDVTGLSEAKIKSLAKKPTRKAA